MTEREFQFWQAYAARKALPSRRFEVAIANLAYTGVQLVNGKTTLTLSNFLLFDKQPDNLKRSMTARDGGSMLGGLTGGKVHKLGQKSRKARG